MNPRRSISLLTPDYITSAMIDSMLIAVSCELNVYFVQAELSEEEKAVLEDEALNTPGFVSELRQEFVENLNALKALSAHGPV